MCIRLPICFLALVISVQFFVNSATARDESMMPTLPQYSQDKHLGVATCGNTTCHALKYQENESVIRGNEYQTWLFHDRHASAYTTLLSDKSKNIAKKIGIDNPAEADICLDCHADNVDLAQQGDEFLMTDGVGCESCHGGSERWVSSHTLAPYNLRRNLQHGMYPTHDPVARTHLCASCHVGSDKKLANHTIMGAGHPRLSFELETFMARQPRHYDIDTDYIERKGNQSSMQNALIAQSVLARQVASNLTGNLMSGDTSYPELVLFDCHACHRPMSADQWSPQASSGSLKPGSIRLNDAHFLTVMSLLKHVNAGTELQRRWRTAIMELHEQSAKSRQGVQRAARKLVALSYETTAALVAISLEGGQRLLVEQTQIIFDALLTMGSSDNLRDYVEAEQLVMLLNVLHQELAKSEQRQVFINNAFKLVDNESSYSYRDLRRLLHDYLMQKSTQ